MKINILIFNNFLKNKNIHFLGHYIKKKSPKKQKSKMKS